MKIEIKIKYNPDDKDRSYPYIVYVNKYFEKFFVCERDALVYVEGFQSGLLHLNKIECEIINELEESKL
jgi:hypothetical protein